MECIFVSFYFVQINRSLNRSSGTFKISPISIIGALNSSFCGLYVPCNDRFFLAKNTNMIRPIAAIKSMPPMVGITATRISVFGGFETFKFGFVRGFLKLGVVGVGGEGVVRLTLKFVTKQRIIMFFNTLQHRIKYHRSVLIRTKCLFFYSLLKQVKGNLYVGFKFFLLIIFYHISHFSPYLKKYFKQKMFLNGT